MGHSTHITLDAADYQLEKLGDGPNKLRKNAGLLGLIISFAAFALGMTGGNPDQFATSWLIGAVYVTTVGLGGLFFVMLQHLVKAGWSVVVRRLAEITMMVIPFGGILLAPVLIATAMGYTGVFHWTSPELLAVDKLTAFKTPYLDMGFFLVRIALYFASWMWLTNLFYKKSLEQDESGDVEITRKLQFMAAPGILIYSLTVSFFAFDVLMSLDPHWFSTIFGVYLFAGAHLSLLCVVALSCTKLMKNEHWKKVLTIEHLHDVGKLMFGFVFFWGYVAFSQYMLYWYANIAETLHWFKHRSEGTWGVIFVALLIGHFVVPFAGLLSRHVKRDPKRLAFWAVFILVFHAVDLYFIARPNLGAYVDSKRVKAEAGLYPTKAEAHAAEIGGGGAVMVAGDDHAAAGDHAAGKAGYAKAKTPAVGLVDILAILGPILLGLWYVLGVAKRTTLLPVRDPRLGESVSLQNI